MTLLQYDCIFTEKTIMKGKSMGKLLIAAFTLTVLLPGFSMCSSNTKTEEENENKEEYNFLRKVMTEDLEKTQQWRDSMTKASMGGYTPPVVECVVNTD